MRGLSGVFVFLQLCGAPALAADHLATGPRTVIFRFGSVWAVLGFVTTKCNATLNDGVLAHFLAIKAQDPEIFGLGYDSSEDSMGYQEKLYGLPRVCKVMNDLYGPNGTYFPKQATFPVNPAGN